MKRLFCYLNPKAKVSISGIGGKGIFAKKRIKKGELIAIWGGRVMNKKEITKLKKIYYGNTSLYWFTVQVYNNFYLAPKNIRELEDADFFNHSCNPNAGIKGQISLVAMRNIFPGEEITFDYATTDCGFIKFKCNCGGKDCRIIITKDDWKNPKFQRKYQGYISSYIKEKIKKQKCKK